MNQKKIKRLGRWVFFNGLVAGMIVAGELMDNPLTHVGAAIIWIGTFMQLLMCLIIHGASFKVDDNVKDMARPIPMWLDTGYDAALAVFLGWHGWTATAVACFAQIILGNLIHKKAEELLKEKQDA